MGLSSARWKGFWDGFVHCKGNIRVVTWPRTGEIWHRLSHICTKLVHLSLKIRRLLHLSHPTFIYLGYSDNTVDICAFISLLKVTPGGKADLQGILEGDLIDEINNEPSEHLVHLDAQNIIKSSKDSLKLRLVR